MKPISNDEFELSTGKIVYAHRLMLGIGRESKGPHGFAFGYGADGDLGLDDRSYYPKERDLFTLDEKIEIAQYTIRMWQEYLDQLVPK